MIIFDDVTKENIKEHYLNWPRIPVNSFRILILEVLEPKKQILYFI